MQMEHRRQVPLLSFIENDPFTHTDLPDIDVEEDMKVIKNKNKDIVSSHYNLGPRFGRFGSWCCQA